MTTEQRTPELQAFANLMADKLTNAAKTHAVYAEHGDPDAIWWAGRCEGYRSVLSELRVFFGTTPNV